jgi:hypothetical protein
VALNVIGTLPLGGINLTAGAVVSLLPPLLAQLDLALFGSLGLGSFELDFSLQLNAAFAANIALANPLDALLASLQALITVQANLTAMLAGGLPALNLNLSVNIGINVGLMASLGLKLGGIQLLISAALAVKLPVIDFLANLNVGASCVLASFGFATPDTLAGAGASINNYFTVTGIAGIAPGDQVWGALIIAKTPSASVALSSMILV